MSTLSQQLLRRKPAPIDGVEDSHLKRSIGLFALTMIGVGGTIGTGIFYVLSGAVPLAGPAVVWSFVIGGAVAGVTALCYAELAGSVPVSGSTYSYAYTTLGEAPAMGVAACLLLEYGVSTAGVAVGWSQYVDQLLFNLFGLRLPMQLLNAPEEGGWINLPAVIVIVLCGLLLMRGVGESATINAIMVLVKLAVLVFFVAVAITGWNADHFANFAPAGLQGIVAGAGLIFFSFIGLDAVSTAGGEAKNPKRNLPLAIVFALIIVVVMYVAVALTAVGAQAPEKFKDQDAGLAAILEGIVGSSWPGTVVAAGAVISIFSVTLVTLYGQTRIIFAMSRDGMVPPVFSKVNARTLSPVPNVLIVSAVIAVLAAVVPINFLLEMTSIGTLVAFLVVSVAVIILRKREPNMDRGFTLPLHPLIPILSILGCIWIISQLQLITIIVFLIWTAAFLVFYWFYGRTRSHLGRAGAGAVDVPFTSTIRQPKDDRR